MKNEQTEQVTLTGLSVELSRVIEAHSNGKPVFADMAHRIEGRHNMPPYADEPMQDEREK